MRPIRRWSLHDPDARGGQPAGDQRGLLDQRAAERGRLEQDRLRAGAHGVDHRHRRHPTAGGARRGELAVADDRELPAAGAVRLGGDQLGDRGQGAQPLAAPQRLDGGGGVIAQPRRALVVAALGQRRRPDRRPPPARGCPPPSISVGGAPRPPARSRAAVTSRAAGHGDTSRWGQDGPCSADRASRVVQVRTPVNRASSAAVSAASARDRNGPTARSWRGARTTDSRGNASSVSTTHHQRCGNLDRRLYGGACAASSRSSRTPASSACAHSTWSTRVGQRHHLLHPAARVGAVEVLADPAAQVDGGADVEHLAGRSAEQVHAGPVRQAVGEHPLAALRRRHVGQIGPQVGVGVHTLVADPLDQRVQHLDGGAGVVEGAVGRLGGDANSRASAASRTLGASSRRQHPPGQPDRAQHRRPRPGDVALLRRRPSGTRCRSRRCGRPAPRRGRTPETSAAPRRSSGRRAPSPW